MSGFLDELGKKAAERWLGLLALPGLLWTITLIAAVRLRHKAPTTIQPLIDAATDWTTSSHTTAVLVVLLLVLLLTSTTAGLAAIGLSVLVRRTWVIHGRHPPTRWLTTWRLHRWTLRDQHANNIAKKALIDSEPANPVDAGIGWAEALTRRDAIGLESPQRPTWIGDRWHITYVRVHRTHGLDLTVAWPHLWAVLPDNLRTDITAAHANYTATSTLTAWALLYLVPTTIWWPTALITITTLIVSQIRARTATSTLCQLIETAADLHTHTLTRALQPPDPDSGHTLTIQLRKEPPAT